MLAPWKKCYDKPRQHIKKQRHYFTNKSPSSQSYGFSSSHVWMWELDFKESWALKNWCFWTVVLEKTLERSNQSILKEISPEYSLEGLMLKLKLQYFDHLMANNWLIWKDAGKDWSWEEKGTTEDEMVGCHHWLCGHIWVNSRSWWRTERPDILQSMGWQRNGHDCATELNWTELLILSFSTPF